MTTTVSQEAREARISRYLSNEKAARESLATYPESTRQRLEAWQTEQCEWFSDTILEIVAEFITIDDAIRQSADSHHRLVEALEAERTWHEDHDKAISKQPNANTGDNGWRRMEHQERIAKIDAALKEAGRG